MLVGLNIQDIVLIERLTLDFGAGLTVMTGETGAGKSILLDSLGLALGNRADSGLVRHGCAQGVVTAEFFAPENHPVHALLEEQGLGGETQILLRRTVNADGRSRAFINDQPVSAGLLRQVGDVLVEIHGQHDDRGLLDARGHRDLLDLFANHEDLRKLSAEGYAAWKSAQRALDDALRVQEEAQRDEEFLRHAMEELDKLNPQEGEEADLAERRALMQQGESLAEGLGETLEQLTRDSAPDVLLRGAIRRLEKLNAPTGGALDELLATLDRAAIEAEEAVLKLQQVHNSLDFDQGELEAVEARLFEIRALSRKHGCPPDSLSEFKQELGAKLEAIDGGADKIAGLEKQCAAARESFEKAVAALSQSRTEAAQALSGAVNEELPPLKLEKARFKAVLEPLEKDQWQADGGEKVAFEVSTNPGAPFGPLIKIASGGELSRFILALKVALADRSGARTMIFDEVDRGVGGATASAIGDRLARLAESAQLMVVTHSPQVAARGADHWRIQKSDQGEVTVTTVVPLETQDRREEIARMLSGAFVTDEARAAADSLLRGAA